MGVLLRAIRAFFYSGALTYLLYYWYKRQVIGEDLKTCAFPDVLLEVKHCLKDSLVTPRHEAHCTEYFQRRHLRPSVIGTQTLRYDVHSRRVGKHVRSAFLHAYHQHSLVIHLHTATGRIILSHRLCLCVSVCLSVEYRNNASSFGRIEGLGVMMHYYGVYQMLVFDFRFSPQFLKIRP